MGLIFYSNAAFASFFFLARDEISTFIFWVWIFIILGSPADLLKGSFNKHNLLFKMDYQILSKLAFS